MATDTLIQSVSRAVDILEVLAASQDGMRLSDLAQATGLKANTAHNLAATLIARGYVEKVEGPLYRLGPAAARLAAQSARTAFARNGAEVLRACHHDEPDAVWVLCERSGHEIVVVLRMAPEQPGVVQRPQGLTFHPYANASGLALMAFLPDEEALALRERYPFYEFGAHLWGTVEDFREYLAEVREAGHAAPPFPDQVGFRVAAPVYGSAGNVLGALGASMGRSTERAQKWLVQRVERAAQELSATLGGGTGTP